MLALKVLDAQLAELEMRKRARHAASYGSMSHRTVVLPEPVKICGPVVEHILMVSV